MKGGSLTLSLSLSLFLSLFLTNARPVELTTSRLAHSIIPQTSKCTHSPSTSVIRSVSRILLSLLARFPPPPEAVSTARKTHPSEI